MSLLDSRAALLACALALCAALPAARAGTVETSLPAGLTTAGAVEAPGDVASLMFLAHGGEKRNLTFTLKRSSGSALVLDVRLIAPDGTPLDIAAAGGKVKAKDTQWKAKLPTLSASGLWRLEVRGKDGSTGGFSTLMKVADGVSVKGSVIVPVGEQEDIPLPVGDGYAIAVKAKRTKGSGLVPNLVIVDPNGNVVPSSVNASAVNSAKGSLKLKDLEMPVYGEYAVRFSGAPGTGGGVAYAITTKAGKFAGSRPTADAGDSFDTEPGVTTALDGSGSSGGGPLTFVWTQVGGTPVDMDDATSEHPTFVAPSTATTLAFQLGVLERGSPSRGSMVSVAVGPRPIADAGPARTVAPSGTLALDASASSDRSGRGIQGRTWRIISGGGTLSDASAAAPTFTAPATTGVVRIGLVVDDGRIRSNEAEVVVSVGDGGQSVASAGREQYVPRMATVHLSGLGSLRPGGALSGGAQWTQLSGAPVTLDGADSFFPAFTAPRQAADLLFELTVDGDTTTASRTWVHVRGTETNVPPITHVVGPLVASGGGASLDASTTTDTEKDAISTRWALLDGSGATIANPTATQTTASGLADAAGRWVFVGQTRDALHYGAPDLVRVIGAQFAGAPLAHAGADRAVPATQSVGLDGIASAGHAPLTYAWRQISGTDWYDVAASDASFNPSAQRPIFKLPVDLSSLFATRTLTFELIVSDDRGPSAPDFVTITFSGLPRNGLPVVTATPSDTNPLAGQIVTLMGTAVDRDGDPVTVTWTQTGGPLVNLFPSSTSLSPQFTAPASGRLNFRLVANDGFDDSPPADVSVLVDAKPIASVIVTPTSGPAGTPVTMDATGSRDPENRPLTYTWTQTAGQTVAFTQGASSINFASPTGGASFTLVVNDGRQDSDPANAAFSAQTPPPTVAPTASATSAAYGSTITLRANPSDQNPATFTWRQINASGLDPAVTLSNTSAQNPTFQVPLPSSSPFGTSPSATFGVTATRGSQSSSEVTVTVTFFASYNDSTLGSAGNTVYAIIQNYCTNCHSGSSNSCPIGSGSNAAGYGMSSASTFATNSINASSCNSSKRRIVASNASSSFLLDTLNGTSPRMPPSGNGSLTQGEKNLIQDWINQGANTTR